MQDQLLLDLRSPVPCDRAHFEVGDANRTALAWVERWPDWPARAIVLAGPSGSGKSHLARIWAAASDATIVAGHDLGGLDAVPPRAGHIVIEAADAAPDEPLLHLYNEAGEAGRSLLLTATTPPARWAVVLPDLRSRLATLPVAAIGLPGDALLAALLERLLSDQGIGVGPDVIGYVMVRMERSYAAVHRVAAALNRQSLLQQSRLTVPLARAALAELADATPED